MGFESLKRFEPIVCDEIQTSQKITNGRGSRGVKGGASSGDEAGPTDAFDRAAAAWKERVAATWKDRVAATWNGAADTSSSEDRSPSPDDEAGPKSACEEDDDWVLVEHNDFPSLLPTYPKGAIDFSRLELEQVHLVPLKAWKDGYYSWKYYGLLGES